MAWSIIVIEDCGVFVDVLNGEDVFNDFLVFDVLCEFEFNDYSYSDYYYFIMLLLLLLLLLVFSDNDDDLHYVTPPAFNATTLSTIAFTSIKNKSYLSTYNLNKLS